LIALKCSYFDATNGCGRELTPEPVLKQLRRGKWNWLGQMSRRNDVVIAKQAL